MKNEQQIDNPFLTNKNGIVGKICNRCKLWYPITEYCKSLREKTGLQYICKSCQHDLYISNHKFNLEYRKDYYQKNRKTQLLKSKENYKCYCEILANLKSNGCAICGYSKCNGALDFHHANPEDKLFLISSKFLKHSKRMVIDELNKCILLCANCHREMHYK